MSEDEQQPENASNSKDEEVHDGDRRSEARGEGEIESGAKQGLTVNGENAPSAQNGKHREVGAAKPRASEGLRPRGGIGEDGLQTRKERKEEEDKKPPEGLKQKLEKVDWDKKGWYRVLKMVMGFLSRVLGRWLNFWTSPFLVVIRSLKLVEIFAEKETIEKWKSKGEEWQRQYVRDIVSFFTFLPFGVYIISILITLGTWKKYFVEGCISIRNVTSCHRGWSPYHRQKTYGFYIPHPTSQLGLVPKSLSEEVFSEGLPSSARSLKLSGLAGDDFHFADYLWGSYLQTFLLEYYPNQVFYEYGEGAVPDEQTYSEANGSFLLLDREEEEEKVYIGIGKKGGLALLMGDRLWRFDSEMSELNWSGKLPRRSGYQVLLQKREDMEYFSHYWDYRRRGFEQMADYGSGYAGRLLFYWADGIPREVEKKLSCPRMEILQQMEEDLQTGFTYKTSISPNARVCEVQVAIYDASPWFVGYREHRADWLYRMLLRRYGAEVDMRSAAPYKPYWWYEFSIVGSEVVEYEHRGPLDTIYDYYYPLPPPDEEESVEGEYDEDEARKIYYFYFPPEALQGDALLIALQALAEEN